MEEPENSSTECCGDLKTKFEDWKASAEKSVRDEPVKTAGLAFVAGLFLTVLPVGKIVSALIRVAFTLVRPALLILGVVKVIEQLDKRKP